MNHYLLESPVCGKSFTETVHIVGIICPNAIVVFAVHGHGMGIKWAVHTKGVDMIRRIIPSV
jgi:hypothetical protein